MLADHVRTMFEYNYWTNRLILDKAEAVTKEEFLTSTRFPRGSMRDTLTHIYYAEWIWRKRCQGQSPVAKVPTAQDFPDLTALRKAWKDEEKAMREFLGGLSDETLLDMIAYTATSGKTYGYKLVDILTHVVIHGMQHRAEVAQMLTELSQSPGDIDYILYKRENK